MPYLSSTYKLLDLPESTAEATAYELLKVHPDLAMPELVRGSLKRRLLLLRENLPGPEFIPAALKLERELKEAAALLTNPTRRKSYDEKLSRERSDPQAMQDKARRLERLQSCRRVVAGFLDAEGKLGPAKRPPLERELQALGMNASEIGQLMEEVPGSGAGTSPHTPQILSFFAETVDLEIGDGVLFESGERHLTEAAERLGIAGHPAKQIIDQRLSEHSARREKTASRAEVQFETQVRAMFPEGKASPFLST